jgi:uncharacterized protein (DUF2252 family)
MGQAKAAPLRTQATPEERRAYGKSLREVVHRVDQAAWSPSSHRADPVAGMQAFNAGRLPQLVPIKMGRMAASPFGFFRGAAPLMAADLAGLPVTGMRVQMCGDAHIRNLGAYAAPDGQLVFDLNDFDETMPGPWEWDLKRLATSVVLAGQEAGDKTSLCRDAVLVLVRAYREAMEHFSEMPVLDLARYLPTGPSASAKERKSIQRGPVHAVLRKAERATAEHSLKKLTVPVSGGWRRFDHQPPLLERMPAEVARRVIESLGPYRETLGAGHQQVLDAYRPVDVAFKVVGTGSVALRDYVVLCQGNGPQDPLFVQVKEAQESCYAPYLKDVPRFAHQGRRVAEGQHRIQTVSDPLLGWTTIEDRFYLVRQLSDHKASVDPEELKGEALKNYALVCGEILAKAHARTGDPAAIAGYCGNNAKLDKAVTKFALAYAEQTAADHADLVQAIKTGRVKAIQGV